MVAGSDLQPVEQQRLDVQVDFALGVHERLDREHLLRPPAQTLVNPFCSCHVSACNVSTVINIVMQHVSTCQHADMPTCQRTRAS